MELKQEPKPHYVNCNGVDVPEYAFIKWADLEEEETETDCDELEEELDAFIKSGKAIKEENCGTYTTTYIDPLKVARHFAKWGMEHKEQPVLDDSELEKAAEEYACSTHLYWPAQVSSGKSFIAGAKWGAEHTFTHHETDESLQEAVTHQMEDDQTIDDYVRKGLDEVCLRYAELGAKWGAEHRDRFLNWIRDLIKAGIEKPEEALNILKRIDTLINDNSLWAEHLKK